MEEINTSAYYHDKESHQTESQSATSLHSHYKLKKHYQLEKKLASRLRSASAIERTELYGELYDELFRCIPFHPMLVSKKSPETRRQEIEEHVNYLDKFLDRTTTFVEVGAGDCTFSFEVAKRVKKVYAIDVCEVISEHQSAPDNFQLILSDGIGIPVPDESINVVYSNQLMEHLHPEDAKNQLQNIYKALVKGGLYFCETPNRLNGPHDVSFSFDKEATCFHLKEYTTTELVKLFKSIGFSRVRIVIGAKGKNLTLPALPISLLEGFLCLLPYSIRTPIARTKLFQALLDIRILGYK